MHKPSSPAFNLLADNPMANAALTGLACGLSMGVIFASCIAFFG